MTRLETRALWRARAKGLVRLARYVGAPTCCRACAVAGVLRALDHAPTARAPAEPRRHA